MKGTDEGTSAWYYVLVNPAKSEKFLKDLSKNIIHLEDCGKVLNSAYGEDPPQEITSKLKSDYFVSD